MDPASTMLQHITRIKNIARQLSDVDEKVSDVVIMAKILGSLSQKFRTFITAWESVDPARQTLDYLRERLLTEESRISSVDDVTSALAAVNIKQRLSKSRGTKKPTSHSKPFETNKADVECFY